MIRINLLAEGKGKKGKSAPSVRASVPTEAPSIVLVAIVIAVIGLAGNGYYYWMLNHDHEVLVKEMAAAEAENRRLSQVKVRYQEAEKEKEAYRKRVDVIDQLRANQSGPVTLLAMIGDTVNATDAVWLSSMKEEGTTVNLQGMALSASAVANLMSNLQKGGYFKSVEIKETFQDDSVKDLQAFQFTLVCERTQPSAPAPTTTQPAPSKS
jgi:type IV pilus assembly protein PilN